MGSPRVRNELIAADKKKYDQKHNDDGTINKDAIQGRVVGGGKINRKQADRVRTSNAKRAHGNEERARRGRAKSDQRQASQAAAPAGVQNAPYTDHVRAEKDKAAKRLKEQEKRSYYED